MLPIWEQGAKGHHGRFGMRSRRGGAIGDLESVRGSVDLAVGGVDSTPVHFPVPFDSRSATMSSCFHCAATSDAVQPFRAFT